VAAEPLPYKALACRQTGRLWWPGWRPILRNRTRTPSAPCSCRCIRPRGRVAHRPRALAVMLEAYPIGQSEKLREALLEAVVAGDLTRISRITRPRRVRRNLSSRLVRLNWWAWV
jgi:hypothetical protein